MDKTKFAKNNEEPLDFRGIQRISEARAFGSVATCEMCDRHIGKIERCEEVARDRKNAAHRGSTDGRGSAENPGSLKMLALLSSTQPPEGGLVQPDGDDIKKGSLKTPLGQGLPAGRNGAGECS